MLFSLFFLDALDVMNVFVGPPVPVPVNLQVLPEEGEEECEESIDYEITCKIIAKAPGYNPITGMCRFCLQ